MTVGAAKATTIIAAQIEPLPKVEVFLDSKGRDSKQTRNSYLTSLVHFDEFISSEYAKYGVESFPF
jgi:hypothetical protein